MIATYSIPIEFTEPLRRLPAGRPLWLSLSLPCGITEPEFSFLPLLARLPDAPRFYWESSRHPLSLLGWGKAAELTDWGEHRFHGIQVQAEHFATRLYSLNPTAPPAAGPRWFGSFSFLPRTADDSLWQAFPDAYFLLPRMQFAHLQGQLWLTINHLVEPEPAPQRPEYQQCLEEFFQAKLAEAGALLASAGGVSSALSGVDGILPTAQVALSLSHKNWDSMVNGALQQIAGGVFEKVVLARTLQVRFDGAPAFPAILHELAARYPDCYRFMLEPTAGQVFLGASPELLAEVDYGLRLRTAALAGTIRRGNDQAEDEALGRRLLQSPKERQEHAIVVRAIQSKLAPLVESLQVAMSPTLRKLGNVQHMETPISAELTPGCGVLDVVAALHPTPALGGWPPEAAQAYLAQAEPGARGWYAAPLGWMDPWGGGLFAVGIRSGLFRDRSAVLFAGAGIVAGSTPEKEWRETSLKFAPLLQALGGSLPHG